MQLGDLLSVFESEDGRKITFLEESVYDALVFKVSYLLYTEYSFRTLYPKAPKEEKVIKYTLSTSNYSYTFEVKKELSYALIENAYAELEVIVN